MDLKVVAFALMWVAGGRLAKSEPDLPPTTARSELPASGSISETTDMASPASTEPRRANQLIKATSPYLLQHAHNPVDWHEWGPEALDKARREDKPIFLSIGYAACHWCHVMEHESFESDEVAAVLNRSFVSVKVDREERPDIDELYMAYTQATTGHGGWPMSVWLHPDGTPFYAGTYFPKDNFLGVLGRIEELWRSDRGQISQHAGKTREFFDQWAGSEESGENVLSRDVIERIADTIARHFDRRLGGLASGQNKFPPSMAMDLMLRVHRRTGNQDLLDAVTVTLDHMARGGIYDHVGGGICRYSTDPEWLVPHFEKMLYDQAMVSSVYIDAYLARGNREYADVARDIFDYVLTDLQSPSGGFCSSRDADSGGFEGAYYIWTVEQIREALGATDSGLFCKYYDVTETGNWFERFGHAPPGPKNILHVSKPPGEFAKLHNIDEVELRGKVVAWRSKLREVRAARTPPPLDDKVLTSWNGLMIASLAKGARALDEPRYAEAAARAARFVLDTMRSPDGRLLRTSRNGESRLMGYLEDYAFFIEGLLNLYEATFDRRWLDEARKLADLSIRFYFDEKDGGFFFTASDGERLLARSKSPNDGAIPSGNSVHATNLMRLGLVFDDRRFREKADSIFEAFGAQIARSPGSFERLASAADFRHDKVKEVVIVGDLAAPGTTELLRAAFGRYLPNKVVMHAVGPVAASDFPLLKGKGLKDGKPTAYVCENYGCKLPVTSAEDLIRQLTE